MADIQWKPQTFSTIKMNPAVALGAASRAFGDIQKNIADQKAVDSLAAYRDAQTAMAQEELDYKTGAEARAIAEEERKLAKSVEQGLLAEQIAKQTLTGSGEGAKGDALFKNMMASNDPRLTELTGLDAGQTGPIMPGALEAFDKFTSDNATAMIPAAEYRDTVLNDILKTGKIDYNNAVTIADRKTAEAYPTASDDDMKMRLDALKNMPGFSGASGKGGAGVMKDATPGRTMAGIPEMIGEMTSARDLNKTPDTTGVLSWVPGVPDRADVGLLDPAQSDLSHIAGRLQKEGATDTGALRATLDEAFDPTYGNKIKKKYDWRTEKGYKALKDYALDQQKIQSRKINSKTGEAAANTAADAKLYGEAVDQIFSLGTNKNYSDDELFQAFLADQGPAAVTPPATGQTPPAAGGNQPPPAVTPAPGADATVDPNVQADAGALLTGLNLDSIPDVDIPQTRAEQGMDWLGNTAGIMGDQVVDAGAYLTDTMLGAPGNLVEVLGNVGEAAGGALADRKISQNKGYAANVKNVIDSVNKGDITTLDSRDVQKAIDSAKNPQDAAALAKILKLVQLRERQTAQSHSYMSPRN